MSTLQIFPRVVPRWPEQVRLYLEWKMCIYSKSLYTNLPKRNTLFFNCTSISCCCENNFIALRKSSVLWFTSLYENSCRNCSVTTSQCLLRREKKHHLFKMCCWQLTAHQSNLEMKICDAEVRLFI